MNFNFVIFKISEYFFHISDVYNNKYDYNMNISSSLSFLLCKK